jgi:hypothetical protein
MRQLLSLAGVLLFISACSKNDTEPLRKFISFQAGGVVILSENPQAIYTPANLTDTDPSNDYARLTITGVGNHEEAITFTLISPTDSLTTGNYNSSHVGNSLDIGFSGIPQHMVANNQYGSLDFNITKGQDSLFEGNFSGTIVDSTGTITNKAVTDGFIRAVIRVD